jgi:hypothetical protein
MAASRKRDHFVRGLTSDYQQCKSGHWERCARRAIGRTGGTGSPRQTGQSETVRVATDDGARCGTTTGFAQRNRPAPD